MFVERRGGQICGTWTQPQNSGQEEVSDGAKELADFIAARERVSLISAKRSAALDALRNENLQARLGDPTAPQEVKDYKQAIEN